jgi:hypothetical protein
MKTISKERREELRDWCQMNAIAAPMHRLPTRGEVLALLDKADELDALKAMSPRDRDIHLDGGHQYRSPDLAADLPGAERNEPHAPTVAAALREVGLCMSQEGVRADALFERAAEIVEGREDG